jgi:hypothetical protein
MRTISTVALLIAALLLARSGAMAGQVTANGHYQQFARTTACGGLEAVSCTLTFGALPSGKNLIVRQVSCFMAMTSGGVRYVALESYTPTGTAPLARTFITPILGTGAGFNTASAAVTHVVAAGQRLKVNVNFTSGQLSSVECSVVGDLLAS